MSRPLSNELHRALAQVRGRLRAQRVLDRAARALALAAAALALFTLLDRLYLTPAATLSWAIGVTAGLFIWACARAALRPVSNGEAARHLDRHFGSDDRFAAAVDFSDRLNPTPWMVAAIQDAERRLQPARVPGVQPLRSPRHGRHAAWALCVWLAITAILIPAGELEAQARATLEPPEHFELGVVALDAQAQEELLEAAREEAPETPKGLNSEIQSATEELNALIRGLRSDTVRLETAHQRLASLEAKLKAFDRENGESALEELERAKGAAAKRRRSGRDVSPLLDAIREAQWKEAAQALEKLAKSGPRDKRRLGRDLERLAKRLESERARQSRALKKERRRLQQKRDKSGSLSRRDRRRLRKNKRSLERLERETARAGETGRHLERLERELRSAAQDLLRRSGASEASSEAMKRAADLLRRLQRGEMSRDQMRRLTARSEALRELLRRAAQRGKKGKKGGEGDDGRTRFMRLARGEGGSKKGGAQGQDSKRGKSAVLLGRSQSSRVTMVAQSASGGSSGRDPASDGEPSVGKGHDPNLLGERERTASRTRDVNVAGEPGEGPSSRQVVSAAAQRGFATRGWKRVHQDYRGVVEERMERQSIPAGHRRYVRRYFELIRPR